MSPLPVNNLAKDGLFDRLRFLAFDLSSSQNPLLTY